MLPGLGADARLFAPQTAAFPGSVVPAWIAPRPREPIGDYAARFAETIDRRVPYALVGFSFGGLVALEIARRTADPALRPAAVVLISGLRSAAAVSRAFKVQQAIGTLVPPAVAKAVIAGPLASAFAWRDGLSREQAGWLSAMARDIDVAFLFWAARACARWDCDGVCPVPVHHVHGRRDPVIPYVPHPHLPGGEATLLDAGHLITWTASEKVNAFIAAAVGA